MRASHVRRPLEPAWLLKPSIARSATWSKAIAPAVAGLVAGSGALNLTSLMGGPLPGKQAAWLRGLFPLDFLGVSRTLTMLSGFALILAAVHLWARRRRAWQLAFFLANASIVLHLTKGWNLEEALCSALIAGLLWFTRRQFVFGAGRPRLGLAAMRAAGAFTIAGIYGAVGFWLLEPADFHHNFHWWEAALRAVRLMLMLGDPTLVPQTPHAVWFLNSLLWLSATTFLYTGFVLFRPVAYRFRINWEESALAQRIATEHGQTGQDYFKHFPDKSYFFSTTRRSFLGYRVAGHYALVLGDPVGPESDLESTIGEFVSLCQARGWRVGFYQVGERHLAVYHALGFYSVKIGEDAIVDLSCFSLSGSARKEFRNTVNRLDRLGYRVERIDPPLAEHLLAELQRISDSWLAIRGHRERQFALGRFERWYVESTPVYVALDSSGRAVAFLNLVPSYESDLATVDLMRRRRDEVNGLMDYLFAKVFLDLKGRGFLRFSLGMAPFSTVSDSGAESSDQAVVHWLFRTMPFLFRTDSLRKFKAKYADQWLPRYAVCQSRFDLPRFALALWRVSECRPVCIGGMA